ncbi:MAG: helix-turn-helix transcriptional regulator [Melioribacteraceae bacterium]
MNNEALKRFSEELKLAREKKKLSLDDIFNKTRIDIKYLEAIESGNFSIMPDVYIRAFLKEYANSIDLSSTEILEKYKLAQSGELYKQVDQEAVAEKEVDDTKIEKSKVELQQIEKSDAPKFVSEEFEKPISGTSSNPVKKTFLYFLSAVGMLAVIYFMYNTILDETTLVEEKPFIEVLKSQDGNIDGGKIDVVDNSKRENIDAESLTPKNIEKIEANNYNKNEKFSSSQFGKLSLTITGTSRSWMRVLIDDEKTNEFIIDYDIKKILYAKEKFYLHIGNSGGVTLLLNGKNLKLNGSEGRVRKISVTKDGIEYLRRSDF